MSRVKNSLGTYKMRGLIELLQLYKSKSNNAIVNNAIFVASRRRFKDNDACNVKLGAKLINDNAASADIMAQDEGKPTPLPKPLAPTPRPPPAGGFPWLKMVLGSLFSLLLAFRAPWSSMLKIGGEVEVVLKEVEQAAQVVEKVATVVEKVSEDVADKLPDDIKLKQKVLVVEHISQEAAKDAHIAGDIIHKVEGVTLELEDVEHTLEPIIKKFVHDGKSNEAVKSNL